MQQKFSLSDWLSISRIPLAILFVAVFSPHNTVQFALGIFIAFVALVTDILDGYLARHQNTVSLQGYMLDGLGDKSFYSAMIIVAVREGFSPGTLATILIVRELALYSLRAIDPEMKKNLQPLRIYSRAHALFIRLYLAAFFIWSGHIWFNYDGGIIRSLSQSLGWMAAIIGIIGLILLIKQMWQRGAAKSKAK